MEKDGKIITIIILILVLILVTIIIIINSVLFTEPRFTGATIYQEDSKLTNSYTDKELVDECNELNISVENTDMIMDLGSIKITN